MRCDRLGKFWNMLMTIDLLQCSGYLCDVLLSIIFKQLKLSVHTINHLFLLVDKNIEGLLCVFVLLCACVIMGSLNLNVFECLTSFDFKT